MRIIVLLVCFLLSSATAQVLERPTIKSHDSWTYTSTVEKNAGWRQTHEEYTVLRATETEILVSIKEAGSKLPPKEMLQGADWSRFRNVNGREEVVNKPLLFPLEAGKTWEIDYTELHPNREHSRERFHSSYKAVGWEEVTVPAGTFLALKIESQGRWLAELVPAASASTQTRADNQGTVAVTRADRRTPQTATGRLYKAVWYVPAVKRYVKSVEEYFAANGVRNERYSLELEAFKVQPNEPEGN